MLFDYLRRQTKEKLRVKVITISVVLILITVLSSAVDFRFELLQYEEMGSRFAQVLMTNTYASLTAMLISFCIIFVLILITNLIIFKRLKRFYAEENMEPRKLPNLLPAFIVAFVGAILTKDFIYQDALVYLNAEMFNNSFNADPIFGKNFGYYMFQRPFLLGLSSYVSGILLIMTIYSIAYYIITFGAVFNAIEIKSLKKNGVVSHIIFNVTLFFLAKIASFGLTAESILFSRNGRFFGADYTEVKVWLNICNAAPFVLAVIVFLTIVFLLRSKYKRAVITILIYPAFWVLGLLAAAAVDLIWVLPNEVSKEKSYINHNIELTRLAYNLSDKLQVRDMGISDSLTEQVIGNNKDLINNIRVLDYTTTLDAQNKFQSFRSYYSFGDADIVKYDVKGKPLVAYLSPRELDQKNLDEKSYENVRFRYTHGYGAVMTPVNAVAPEGYPQFTIKDIPVVSGTEELNIARPEIYFGKMAEEHIIVNIAGEDEINYPEGDTYKKNRYDGTAGIKLTPLNRIVMALKLGDPGMLFSSEINSQSKVLINRQVTDRVQLAAPFLNVEEEDAYLIINNGRLLWVVDAYTHSINFPYSQPTLLKEREKLNYIRNSVKVTVDAYDGTIKFYVVDTQDPIIMTYKKIYPGLFEVGTIPKDIAKHIKYPKRLMEIQAEILKRYHVSDEARFFNGKDLWDIPTYQDKSKKTYMKPYYVYMKMRGAEEPELVLTLPFVSEDGSHIAGILTAGQDTFGKLMLYRFPSNRYAYSPRQFELGIDKEQDIAKAFNLWRQNGSSVIQGNMLVVPLEDEKDLTLLYIKPIYVWSESSSPTPQLKRIIVGCEGRVVMEENLTKAINKLQIVSRETQHSLPESSGNRELIETLLRTYEELKMFSNDFDWENFGSKMKELDEIISELNNRKEEF